MQILVLGMHRSGTSVVARLLNLLGAYFAPEDLVLPPQQDNPKGFWERRDVLQLNDEILASVNGAWDRVGSLELDQITAEQKASIESEIRTIVAELEHNRHWMIKDPRLCLTLPFWRPNLGNPVCVYVYRNPIQVAKSLARRNGFPIHFGLALWEYYTVSALNASRGMPRVVIDYEQVMADPLTAVTSLHKKLSSMGGGGFEMPDENDVLGFLEESLFHEKSEDGDFRDYLSLSQLYLVELFKDGTVLKQNGSLQASRNAIDILVEQQAFVERLAEEDKEKGRLVDKLSAIKQSAGSLEPRLRSQEAEILEGRGLLDQMRSENSGLKSALDEALCQKTSTDTLLREKDRRLLDLDELLREKDGRLLALDELLREKDGRLLALEGDFDRMKGDYANVSLGLDEMTSRNNDLAISLEKLTSENDKLDQLLSQRNKNISSLQGEIKALTGRLEETSSSLSEELKEKQEKIAQLEEMVRELELGIQTIFRSRRWRFSSPFSRLCSFALLKSRSRTPQEHLESILADFNGTGDSNGSGKEQASAGKGRALFGLAVASGKHPIRALQLLNVGRVKSLFRILFREPAPFATDVVGNYLRAYGFSAGQVVSAPQPMEDLVEVPKQVVLAKSKNPLVSIIIPVYNNFGMTMSCLDSIAKNTKDVSYEVIIGDDRSTDTTCTIKEHVKHLTVVRNFENLGFLKNCNNAARRATGKYLVLLNNDTNVLDGWLSELVRVVENDPSVGSVGSKLLFADGKLQEAGGIIWKDASGWNYGRGDDPEKPEYNYLRETDYVSAACFLTRHSLWKDIGGFDNHFCPAYYEDTDFSFEVRKRGYKVVYQPKSVIVHFDGASHGTDVNSGIKQYQVVNQKKFFEKWRKTLEEDHFENGEKEFTARDRSRKKKTILVVDHYVPHFDKDAGSKHTYQYLKWFVEMGMNVKFIGDNYYRHEPYTTELQQLGIEVLYGPYYAVNWKKWLKGTAKEIDYIYLHRPHISLKYIDVVKSLKGPKILYFGHDLHYMRILRQYEVEKDTKLLRDAEVWKEKELSIFHKADVVYYPSTVEVAEIKKSLPRMDVRAIPLYLVDPIEPAKHEPKRRKDLLFVGGFRHTPNVDAAQWFVADILPRIVKEDGSIRLIVVGSNMPDSIRDMASKNVFIAGEVSEAELVDLYQRCRVVVVPLRYGAGIKGKVLESMQLQVPVVTTSIGAEGIPAAETYLRIADSANDFADKVLETYSDHRLWCDLADAGREAINSYFSKGCAREVLGKDIDF